MQNLSDAHTEQPSLRGRKALVTGGTTGIGRAIAVLLASEGVKVFVCGRDKTYLQDALARIAAVGDGSGTSGDVSKPEDLKRIFDEAGNWLGGLDIAVINAAIPSDAPAEMSEEELRYAMETDFVSYVVSAQHAARTLAAGADIVLIGSMSAESNMPGSSSYVAAKAGIQAFSESLRKELSEKDIKVGLIEPGFTGADFQYPEFPPEKQVELIHQHKMLRAEDIAASVFFMLTQPRRTAVSLMRVQTRLNHP
jgi:NAD(P)-dependent dehydrogenase (short-subunit alcohol dehydrogenase family)